MERAKDSVQHLAGDRDEALQFGFVACQQGPTAAFVEPRFKYPNS
jgi:hypothetical protein